MTERSNKKKYPLCAAALALAVLLAGCAPAEGAAVATAQPTAEPTEAPTPTPEPEMNPLTGEQGDYTNQRPVAVSIRTGDGSTPQWGIAAADVLIEGVTEGKTAGLTAVFASVDSVEKAGPVAPGRDLPLQLVLPLNAVPVHINKSVYASNLLNVLQYQDLDGYHAGTAGFAFDEDRANSGYREENCWYTTAELINSAWQKECSLFFSVEEVEQDEFDARIAAGKYTIALAPIRAEGGSVYQMLQQFTAEGGSLTGYADTVYADRLALSAQQTGKDRCALLAQCERQLLESCTVVPLMAQQKRLLLANGVRDLVFDPFFPVLDLTWAKMS